jgi:hypothetical protein
MSLVGELGVDLLCMLTCCRLADKMPRTIDKTRSNPAACGPRCDSQSADARSPRLRRAVGPPRQESRDRALRDVDAKLPQFAVDPRCTPEWIRRAHLRDERPKGHVCGRGMDDPLADQTIDSTVRAADHILTKDSRLCLHLEL